MLVDLHAHTSGISVCCKVDAPQILKAAREAGIDGIVLTNHYQKEYVKDGDIAGFVNRYEAEYLYTRKEGEKLGVKVFFGVEVTMAEAWNIHLLVYGITPDTIRKSPFLFNMTQQELYRFVKENGGTLMQAHPFRNGATVMDTDYLDGIEINCHPIYLNSYLSELFEIAKKNNLSVICGGDYHADTYRPKCGVYLPDDITDEKKLSEYISTAKQMELCVQEPYEDEIKTITVYKK